MGISQIYLKAGFKLTTLFAITIMITTLLGSSFNEEEGYEIIKYFLNFDNLNSLCQSVSINTNLQKTLSDSITVDNKQTYFVMNEWVHLLSTLEKQSFIANVLKNLLTNKDFNFVCYFGDYNINMWDQKYLQFFTIENGEVELLYQLKGLIFRIYFANNLEVKEITVSNQYGPLRVLNIEEFNNLDLSNYPDGSEAVNIMKEQIKLFPNLSELLREIGLNSELEIKALNEIYQLQK